MHRLNMLSLNGAEKKEATRRGMGAILKHSLSETNLAGAYLFKK